MRARGFTLVEVMVALAIVAITLPALLMALYQQVDDAAYLRDKTLAEMVAVNKLAEMRLVVASTREIQESKDNGDTKFADRDWYWWTETKSTGTGKIFRVDIQVALAEDQREHPLYTLTASIFGDLVIDKEAPSDGDGSNDKDSNGNDGNGSGDSNGSSGTGDNSSGDGSSAGEAGGSSGDASGGIPSGLGEGGSSDGQ